MLGESGEERLLAHVTNLKHGHRCCTVLARGDACIWGAEHLLAALEACGVDNARIEIEGGRGAQATSHGRCAPCALARTMTAATPLPACERAYPVDAHLQKCPLLMAPLMPGPGKSSALGCGQRL